MRSSFTSCIEIIPVGKLSFLASTDRYTTAEFGLCESIIVIDENNYTFDKGLFTLSIDQLLKLNIESLKISDGSDIWKKQQVTIDSLQIFTSVSVPYKPHITGQWFKDNDINIKEDQFYRICVWYELIKILTGNQFFCSHCDNVIEYSDFVCHYNTNSSDNIDNVLSFALELHSNTNIVRNLAQFRLDMVQNGEIDLFLLSSKMFESLRKSNSIIKNLLQENNSLREQIDRLINEREQLDTLIEKRDNITRNMTINLLNEKKSKIKELESKLSYLQTNHVVDSDLINKYVHNPIFQLNSPGKKKRKLYTDLESPVSSIRKKNLVKIRNDSTLFTNIKNNSTHISYLENQNNDVVKPKFKTNTNNDTFDDFDNSKFLGINKAVNLDNLDLRNLMKPAIETPKLRIKDEITIKNYNNDDISLPYELIKKEDFTKTFDNYIDQDNGVLASNNPSDSFKGINLTTIQVDESLNNNERGEKDDEDNMALEKDTSQSETTSETDIDADIETYTD